MDTDRLDSDDERRIKRLYTQYTDAVNRRDPEGMVSIYAQDVQFRITQHDHLGMGRPIIGRDKMLKGAIKLMTEREFIAQTLHSSIIEINSDRAKVRCWFSEIKKPVGHSWEFGFLVFQDEAIKIAEGWRIATRSVASLLRREIQDAHFETWPFVDVLNLKPFS